MKTNFAATLLGLALWGSAGLAGTPADVTVGEAITLAPKSGAGYQDRPAVAFGKDAYLVVWEDGATGFETQVHLMGARVSAEGKLLDAEPIVICKAKGEQSWPRVAWSPQAGVFLVVWNDRRTDSPAFAIYGARVSPEGKVLDPEGFPISADKDRNQTSPDVTACPGGFVVVWQRYWAFPMWGIFAGRVSGDGKLLDGDGVPLLTRDPAKQVPHQPHPWVQEGYLWPRVACREGKTYLSWLERNVVVCRELSVEGKLAVQGEPKTTVAVGFSGGPRDYAFVIGPGGQAFGAASANGGRGGGASGAVFAEAIPVKGAPGGSQGESSVYLPDRFVWNRGVAIADCNASGVFDGQRYWVFYEFGSSEVKQKKLPLGIVGFRVDPKEPKKTADRFTLLADGKPSTMARGSIEVAMGPTWQCHPNAAAGGEGKVLVVYANDKNWDDRRIEAKLVQGK
jgi:hypothetical protein